MEVTTEGLNLLGIRHMFLFSEFIISGMQNGKMLQDY